ncbi:hypothetical protein ACOJQI_11555 [Bacillus salacetis]|uniref:hypothetical protein n=1 Tax=Bacillus salacetis TaxID=2315464 RepID=UPI003BA091CA
MMILKQELIKIIKNPVIPLLLLFFLVVNFLIVISHSYFKEEMSVLTDLVDVYGHEINEEMETRIHDDYEEIVSWVNEIAPNQKGTYNHPSELLTDISILKENPLNHEDYQQLLRFTTIEQYIRDIEEIDTVYKELNLSDYGKSLIDMYGLSGSAAEEVRIESQKLEERANELLDMGEHKHLFFNGKLYEMHSLLFKNIGRALIFELMIIVVLITAALTNYEFEHRTSQVVFATKRGRKLVFDKLGASILGSLIAMMILIAITLTTFFITYDYSGLWDVPISSYFNAEGKLPFITWWNLSFLEYLMLFAVLIILIQLLFSGISFLLSILMKNTYLVFFAFAILLGIGFLLPGYMPRDTRFLFLVNYNPSGLILNPHEWLMGNGPFTMGPYYELITLGLWSLVLVVLTVGSILRFKSKSL